MNEIFEIIITHTAEFDFRNIWSFIAPDSIKNASDFISQLEREIRTLSSNPHRCPYIPENFFFQDNAYRHLIYKSYRIIYSIRNTKVFVLRVFHGSKLLEIAELENMLPDSLFP